MPRVNRELGPDGKELTMPCDTPDLTPTRMFPLQTSKRAPVGPVQIPWSVAEKAYGFYVREYGKGQSLETLAQRGGFGWCEMDLFYPPWREEVSEIAQLKNQLDAAARDRLAAELAEAQHELAVAVKAHNICEVERIKHFERADRAEAELAQAKRLIEGLDKLCVAYRIGGRVSDKTLDQIQSAREKLASSTSSGAGEGP